MTNEKSSEEMLDNMIEPLLKQLLSEQLKRIEERVKDIRGAYSAKDMELQILDILQEERESYDK